MSAESAVRDDLDRRIIRALQLAPRVSFSLLAEVLDVSEQTVGRRYRRLRRDGVLRVTAVVSATALGESNWMVRVQCRPNGAASLAAALAQRDDVGWVSLVSGGSEIMCALRSRSRAARDDLLLERLPRTAPVLGMSSAMILHVFAGGRADDWSGFGDLFDDDQVARLSADARHGDPNRQGTIRLTASDTALLDELTRDGRASFAALATAAGISESAAARRLAALIEDSVVYLDLDIWAPALGFDLGAALYLTVGPADLDRAGRRLAQCPEVAFAAATTGPHNLAASVMLRDLESLYRFVTDEVATIGGIVSMEILPVQRVVKQAGTLTDGDRLAAG